jgi:hypothetical protein
LAIVLDLTSVFRLDKNKQRLRGGVTVLPKSESAQRRHYRRAAVEINNPREGMVVGTFLCLSQIINRILSILCDRSFVWRFLPFMPAARVPATRVPASPRSTGSDPTRVPTAWENSARMAAARERA